MKKQVIFLILILITIFLMNIRPLYAWNGEPSSGVKITSFEIAYGSGKEQVGAYDYGEGALKGPQSFAVDGKGNIYICDTVNKRIQIISPNGEHLSTISLEKGTMADDIVVDDTGFIYIYDDLTKKIIQYAKKGSLISTLHIDSKRLSGRVEMHIIDDTLYMYSCNEITCGDIVIAMIADSSLAPPPLEEFKKRLETGKHATSGKRYMTRINRGREGLVEIIDTEGITSKDLPIRLTGIVSIQFLGEDVNGNLYIKTAKSENNKLFVDIHRLNAHGQILKTMRLPNFGSYYGSFKSYFLNPDGTIYQFLRKEDKVKIYIIK